MKTVTRSGTVGVVTKYLGPTNTRGARIRVWRADVSYRDDANGLTVSWDHSLDGGDNHKAAIEAYLANQDDNWDGCWAMGWTRTGCMAVLVSR